MTVKRVRDPDVDQDPDLDELARLVNEPPTAENLKRMAAALGQDGFRPVPMTFEVAETVAVSCFTGLAADEERMGQFLALTGLTAPTIRDAVRHPAFLAGLLDYVVGDEAVLKAVALASGMSVQQITDAQATLNPSVNWT